MLVSLNWLNNYVDISGVQPEELAEKITKSGIEVDSISYIAEKSTNVVVGRVLACEQHPNADKLNLCQVDVGDETLQIICGAPNIAKGQKVAVAKPGAVLPGNFKIKKAKLRGIESNGMICSLQELGLQEAYIPKDVADGIFVFPSDVKVGEPVEGLLHLDDAVLEFDLTPNRADCLSMLGVAYEVAAILNKPLNLPEETVDMADKNAGDAVTVTVEDKELCPYYGAFVIENVKIGPSPLWMQNYLMAAGIRPINNVVDITNYVLLEYGQPLHAFDYDRFGSNEVVVRRAKDQEQIETLDGVMRTLTENNLLITNGKTGVALAGVMGGADSEVQDDTTTVLLEAAYFDAKTVRKAVLETGLRSESSTRFEKGIDSERVKRAGLRACQLLQKYAGGTVLQGVVESNHLTLTKKAVSVDADKVNKRLGTSITVDEIASILNKLRFDYTQSGKVFDVTVPTRRGDISIFEDMLEEIARIYGYDHIPATINLDAEQAGMLTDAQKLKRKIKRFMEGAGLMETITYSLTGSADVNRWISPEIKAFQPNPVSLSNPMSEDHRWLRLSLLPELLKSLSYNQARSQSSVALYELGSIFVSQEEELTKQPNEQLRLSGALAGKWVQHPWQQEMKVVDFYVVKGILEALFDHLEIPVSFRQTALADMHPGRCAEICYDNRVIGFLGQIHPSLGKGLDLKETYVFDINMEVIIEVFHHEPTYQLVPRYPSISRDVAFVMDHDIKAGDVQITIEEIGAPLVKSVQIFDVYTGENLPEGKKSIAYNLVYQNPERTLTDEEVETSFQDIRNKIEQQYHAYIRS